MRTISRIVLIWLVILTICPIEVFSKFSLLSKVRQRYSGVQTIKGRFEQEVEFPDGRKKLFRGFFYFKGDKSRWDYDEPGEQTVLVLGKRVLIYDPFVGEVQEGSVDFPFVYRDVLLHPERLKRYFKVEEKQDEVVLVPLQDSQLKKVVVHFGRDLVIKKVIVVDAMGNITRLSFKDVKFNEPIPDKLFDIEEVKKGYAAD